MGVRGGPTSGSAVCMLAGLGAGAPTHETACSTPAGGRMQSAAEVRLCALLLRAGLLPAPRWACTSRLRTHIALLSWRGAAAPARAEAPARRRGAGQQAAGGLRPRVGAAGRRAGRPRLPGAVAGRLAGAVDADQRAAAAGRRLRARPARAPPARPPPGTLPACCCLPGRLPSCCLSPQRPTRACAARPPAVWPPASLLLAAGPINILLPVPAAPNLRVRRWPARRPAPCWPAALCRAASQPAARPRSAQRRRRCPVARRRARGGRADAGSGIAALRARADVPRTTQNYYWEACTSLRA